MLYRYPAAFCAGVEAAAFIASGRDVDVMMLDIRMPGKSGLEVVEGAHPFLPLYPIVAMTGQVDDDAIADFKYVQ
jgi:CheY-like chemotaxis protein